MSRPANPAPIAEPRLSFVVVATNERAELERGLPVLAAQLAPGDELIVVDNASTDGTGEMLAALVPGATVVRTEANEGFGAAAVRGAELATGDAIVPLNADVVAQPGLREELARPLREGTPWGAWMPLVTYDDGRLVNTAGGVVHFTGLSWAGRLGEPAEAVGAETREVPFVPGGAMAVRSGEWRALDGFAPGYFMYCEDLDLSLRLRLRGVRVGIVPAARLDHAYEFVKSRRKWRLLERNRWATVIRTYPWPLLAVVAPALALTEVALHLVALAGRWLDQKLLADLDLVRALPRLLRERRAIQRARSVSAAEFAACMTAALDSPMLGPLARLAPLRWALAAYWAAARALLR